MEIITIINSSINNINYIYLIPFFLFIFIHFTAEPIRWSFYLKKRKNPLSNAIGHIFFLTAFLSYLLPMKLGLPIRIGLLKKKLQLKIKTISRFLLIDGILYYGSWASIACIAGFNLLLKFKNNIELTTLTSIALIATGILIFILFFIKIKKYKDKISTINPHTIYTSLNKNIIFSLLFVTYTDITSHILRHWALLGMVGYMLPIEKIFVITSISIFTGLISMMPMGLGGYDITIVLLLTQASVPLEVAIIIPIFNRIGTIFISILFGLRAAYYLSINPFKLEKIRQDLTATD
jgi:uncharacterized membrane protein YbhN (UPF0104 family)